MGSGNYKALREELKQSRNFRYMDEYADYMEFEKNLAPERIYNVLGILKRFDDRVRSKNFKQVVKADVLQYLLRNKKSEEEDPKHRWIGYCNEELSSLIAFYRWLYNQGKDKRDWVTPECVRIDRLKRPEDSVYNENDVWTEEDILFLASKVCDNTRDAFIVTALYDFAAINKDLVNLRLANIKLGVQTGDKEYGEARITAKNRTRVVPLILSYAYARDWLNSHPFRNNPDSFVLVNLLNGKRLRSATVHMILARYKGKLKRMVDSAQFKDKDLKIAKSLLQKPWNPYLVGRHSSLEARSEYLNDNSLKDLAGWGKNTTVPARYLRRRTVVKPILQHYGILQDEHGKKQIVINACPKCQYVNKSSVRFCEKCSYILDPQAWEEVKKEERTLREMVEQLRKDVAEMRKQNERTRNFSNALVEEGYIVKHVKSLEKQDQHLSFRTSEAQGPCELNRIVVLRFSDLGLQDCKE